MANEQTDSNPPATEKRYLPMIPSDADVVGFASDAARSVLGEQDPTQPDSIESILDQKLDTILATDLTIGPEVSPALREKVENLSHDELVNLALSFGHQAVAAEVKIVDLEQQIDEKVAELGRTKQMHSHQVITIRDRHEKEVSDIQAEARTREAALTKEATTDPLTGLLNRAGFVHRLNGIRQFSGRQPSSVMFVDLDKFKDVNDKHGHAVGNKILRRVADVLQSHTRDTDVVARLGGDEYAVVYVGTRIEEAEQKAEVLCEELKSDYISLVDGTKVDVSASIGLSPFDETIRDVDDALLSADNAMYRAKNLGRGQVARVDLAHPDHVEPLH